MEQPEDDMNFVDLTLEQGIAKVTLQHGKVNALNEPMVDELQGIFDDLKTNLQVRAVVVTGAGKFFSFGFDIPGLLGYSQAEFDVFIKKFCQLYAMMFTYPKPLVAALNGHTIAGGCALAITCDYRLMVSGKAKISLNEITLGVPVLAGMAAMLTYWVGDRAAQAILFRGAMYSAEAAREMGLVDQVAAEAELIAAAHQVAAEFAQKDAAAFAGMKRVLRQPVVEAWQKQESESRRQFLDLWYSPATREKLEQIEIRN